MIRYLTKPLLAALVLSALVQPPVLAGGAWVPERGHGDVVVGVSTKTADTSWDPRGDTRFHTSLHDFRYGYLGGEVGLGGGYSLRFLGLYLDGREGEPGDMEINKGLSELYLGLKYRLRSGVWPMALAFTHRSSYLYDLPGTYDRHLFLPDENDADGDGDVTEARFNGVSPEWRGILGEDYGLSLLLSRSLWRRGWLDMELGYRYRTTNLADEVPFSVAVGYPLPWRSLVFKGSLAVTQSVGNYSRERDPEDRFGCSSRNCFPNASYAVLGGSLLWSGGRDQTWWVEGGWNQWIWGRSARKYDEPYLTIGRTF